MKKRKDLYKTLSGLTVSKQVQVRFSEVDSLGIVWHGHYILYFEDGREAFGESFGIGYLAVQKAGFTTPIVSSSCSHKLPLRYGDSARIETYFVDTPAAKLIYRFAIFNQDDQLVCTGETVQVFLDADNNMVYNTPEFMLAWKRKVGLL